MRINGALYFSIYDLGNFIRGMGSVAAAALAIGNFTKKVDTAGLGKIHLSAVVAGFQVLPSESVVRDPRALLKALGFDSATSYAWVHNYSFIASARNFPVDSYPVAAAVSYRAWDRYTDSYGLPYFPNVSMGWDPSPRTDHNAPYGDHGYPWHPVLLGNTPEAYETALRRALTWAQRLPKAERIITLNAWNEWTEGSYLLPDKANNTEYIDAVGRVFGHKR